MWKSKILTMELMLCNKMLQMDERNFHCWNYRLWVTELYISEIEKRLAKLDFKKIQRRFIQDECDMAEAIINKNFSNYSAWHYRGKLMPLIYREDPGTLYSLPLEVVQSDLKMLKHAFFTDPKDQSPWNYHEWLISVLTPVQVVALRLEKLDDEKSIIMIGLSHKVRNFNHL